MLQTIKNNKRKRKNTDLIFLPFVMNLLFELVCKNFCDFSVLKQVCSTWNTKGVVPETLAITHIPIQRIPITFIPKIKHARLALRDSHISNAEVSGFVAQFTALRSLFIDNFDPYLHWFNAKESLQHLDLTTMYLPLSAAKLIASISSLLVLKFTWVRGMSNLFLKLFSEMPNLQSLSFVNTPIDTLHLGQEPLGIQPWPSLTFLKLHFDASHYDQSINSLKLLCSGQRIEILHLSNLPIKFNSDGYATDCFTVFMEVFCLPKLLCLKLINNLSSNVSIETLNNCLNSWPCLQDFHATWKLESPHNIKSIESLLRNRFSFIVNAESGGFWASKV
jgi:hypothetical protein